MPLPKQPAAKPARLPLFTFLPFGPARDGAEIIAASIPGAAVLLFFLVAVGAPTVITNSNWFAAPYIPVTCLLPIVIGMISPLALDFVRANPAISTKRGVACAFLSGLLGSMAGMVIIFTLSIVMGTNNPFGPSVGGILMQLLVALMIVGISSVLAAAGGAILVLFIKKVPKEGQG